MTTCRIEAGIFVKTAKKPHCYGKIIEEKGKNNWLVEFDNGQTRKLKSGQLWFVDIIAYKNDLPATFISHFDINTAAFLEER